MELFKGLTLTTATCALLWLGSEALVRGLGFHGHNVDFEPLVFSPAYGWENKPDYDAQNEELEWSIRYRTNADGFRGKQYFHERTPGTERILVVSDSMGDGFGVTDAEMWQSVLAEKLGGGVEIVNQSVRGYDVIQEYKRYLAYGRQFKPDIIVQMLCDNDFSGWNASVIARYQRYRPQYSVEGAELRFTGDAPAPQELFNPETAFRKFKRLLYHSAAAVYLKHRFTPVYHMIRHAGDGDTAQASAPAAGGAPAADPYDARYQDAAKIVFRDMARFAREDGFKMLIVFVSREPLPPVLKEARDMGVLVLQVEIPKEEMFVYDPFHPRAAGHRRIALAVAGELRP